jgi:predicted O-methyltransferase YrrM
MPGDLRNALRRTLPPGVRRFLGGINQGRTIVLQRALEAVGLNVARTKDYYSPLPRVRDLKAHRSRWCRPSAMRGVVYDSARMKACLSALISKYSGELEELPAYGTIMPYGPGYTDTDGLVLYMMIRESKPRRYVEVGSGMSTYYCSLAAKRNAAEDQPVEITCIEPNPHPELRSLPGIRLREREVQDEDLEVFAALGPRDVLFIDSSHILRLDGDIPFLYLEVLPALAPGVLVHIHDVPFPYNFPFPAETWILSQTWPVYWNEAMMLQAFLAFNREFEITMSLPLLRFEDEEFLKRTVPNYQTLEQQPYPCSSIWLRRAQPALRTA